MLYQVNYTIKLTFSLTSHGRINQYMHGKQQSVSSESLLAIRYVF